MASGVDNLTYISLVRTNDVTLELPGVGLQSFEPRFFGLQLVDGAPDIGLQKRCSVLLDPVPDTSLPLFIQH